MRTRPDHKAGPGWRIGETSQPDLALGIPHEFTTALANKLCGDRRVRERAGSKHRFTPAHGSAIERLLEVSVKQLRMGETAGYEF